VLETLNREHGMTVILIEHRVDLASQYADRVILFADGRILRTGAPEEVFKLEETRLTGVGIPKILELSRRLNQRGLSFKPLPLSPDSFIEQLERNIPRMEIRRHERVVNQDLEGFTGEHSQSPIIQVENVSYAYPNGVQALNGVSLTIHKGEFVAIMGENGAGKTTLVKHFNGLLRPQEGSITVDGVDVSQVSVASLARKVGLVFQSPDDQLFSENVESEISFALNNFGFEKEVVEKRVGWALNLLGIERYRKSSPFILSGGERKRVALASVLAWDPEIVVLDEPTIGQDYAQKERLRHFLMQLRVQGKTTIIVTHDVEFVAECKPRIVLMADGGIIADGTTKEIMTDAGAMERASVSPPEITKIFSRLSPSGLPEDVLDVDEAMEILMRLKEARP
jgi:energy-coupling factor transport system ATP-binding protein